MRNRLAAFLQVLALCIPYTRCNCKNWQFPGAFTSETPCCTPATSPPEKHRVVAGKTKVVAACCSICCTAFSGAFLMRSRYARQLRQRVARMKRCLAGLETVVRPHTNRTTIVSSADQAIEGLKSDLPDGNVL
jgi:hypothetical protein